MIKKHIVYEDCNGATASQDIAFYESINDMLVLPNVTIYPNPANDKVFIETEVEIEEVVVYTITGVIVGQRTTVNGQQTLSINVSDLSKGVYFVNVKTSAGSVVKKIIKH